MVPTFIAVKVKQDPVTALPTKSLPPSVANKPHNDEAMVKAISCNGIAIEVQLGSMEGVMPLLLQLAQFAVLKFPDDIRIHLAVVPVDMRKSFDGLSAVITEALKQHPLSGDLFVFRGKRADRIKAVYWDRNGLVVWSKRLERGKFKCPLRGEHSFPMLNAIGFAKRRPYRS